MGRISAAVALALALTIVHAQTAPDMVLGTQGGDYELFTPSDVVKAGGGDTPLSDATPIVEGGSGAPGSLQSASRGDHIHPEDDSGGTPLSDTTPKVESGAGNAGAATDASRGDHVHPAAQAANELPVPAVADQGKVVRVVPDISAAGSKFRFDGADVTVLAGLPSITGQGGKVLGVNPDANALLWVAGGGSGPGGNGQFTLLQRLETSDGSVTFSNATCGKVGTGDLIAIDQRGIAEGVGIGQITKVGRNEIVSRSSGRVFNAAKTGCSTTGWGNGSSSIGVYKFTGGGAGAGNSPIPDPTVAGKLQHLRVNAAGAAYELADPPITPLADTVPVVESGSGKAGSATAASRGDHAHPARVIRQLPANPGGTAQTFLGNTGSSPSWVQGEIAPSFHSTNKDDCFRVNQLGTGVSWRDCPEGGGGADLSDATPLVESGGGAPGTATEASRDDHVHPLSPKTALSNNTPIISRGTGAPGTHTAASREDHVHPQPSVSVLLADQAPPGIQADGQIGASDRAARQDHTHSTFTEIEALDEKVAAIRVPPDRIWSQAPSSAPVRFLVASTPSSALGDYQTADRGIGFGGTASSTAPRDVIFIYSPDAVIALYRVQHELDRACGGVRLEYSYRSIADFTPIDGAPTGWQAVRTTFLLGTFRCINGNDGHGRAIIQVTSGLPEWIGDLGRAAMYSLAEPDDGTVRVLSTQTVEGVARFGWEKQPEPGGLIKGVKTGSNEGGTEDTYARTDHEHAIPSSLYGTPVDIGRTNQAGTATTLARSDHVHEGRTADVFPSIPGDHADHEYLLTPNSAGNDVEWTHGIDDALQENAADIGAADRRIDDIVTPSFGVPYPQDHWPYSTSECNFNMDLQKEVCKMKVQRPAYWERIKIYDNEFSDYSGPTQSISIPTATFDIQAAMQSPVTAFREFEVHLTWAKRADGQRTVHQTIIRIGGMATNGNFAADDNGVFHSQNSLNTVTGVIGWARLEVFHDAASKLVINYTVQNETFVRVILTGIR